MKRVILLEDKRIKEKTKVKVAAYCRVSTDHIDQNGSLEYQKYHFEKLLKSNENCEFVEIYSDVGSGLRVKNRPGYMKMIKDGNNKKFDLVFVKSLSRLGRDTLQIMKLIRRWRKMGIGIISELEQINTLENRDFMIDIALAVAQDYSRAKSNNIKFGIRQRMREGKTILNHTQFLGYTKGTMVRLL